MARVIGLRSLALGVNIGTGLFTAAILGPSGRGELAALLTAPGFLSGLASLGLHSSLIYNMKAEPESERNYLGNGILLTFATGMTAAVIGLIMEPYFLSQYSAHTILMGRILLLSTPFTVMTWTLLSAAEANGWFGFANRTLYLQNLTILILLFLLYWFDSLTATTAAFAYIFPAIPVFGYFYYHVVRRIKPVMVLRWDFVRKLFNFGLRFCGMDLLGILAAYLDQVLVVLILPPNVVGNYAVALSLSRLLQVIQSGVLAVLFPSTAARSQAHVVQSVTVAYRVVLMVTSAAALLLVIAGPPMLLLAYGLKFAGAIAPFRILLAAMVISNGNGILYQIYVSSGRPELATLLEAVATGVLLAGMLTLVPFFGTIGAASAVLFAAIFRLIVISSGLRYFFDVRPSLLVPGWRDVELIWTTLIRLPPPEPRLEPGQ